MSRLDPLRERRDFLDVVETVHELSELNASHPKPPPEPAPHSRIPRVANTALSERVSRNPEYPKRRRLTTGARQEGVDCAVRKPS
jgi:hypothetical protein